MGIHTVNQHTHSEYFIGNDVTGSEGVQLPLVNADGLTAQLEASGVVNSTGTSSTTGVDGGWNTFKIVIADVGDRMLDSWLLLSGGSLTCHEVSSAELVSSQQGQGRTNFDSSILPLLLFADNSSRKHTGTIRANF